MIARSVHLTFILATTPLLNGCHQSRSVPASTATPITGTVTAPSDYRMLSKTQLQELIRSKTGLDMSDLTDASANRYTATVKSPDGTITMPLEVSVEAQRIVCETKTPAGSTRQIITPQGVQSDLDVK